MSELQKAYEMVLRDMMESECGLFVGKYDAENGNKSYMLGIQVVMCWIAYHVNEATGEEFSSQFINNLILSEEKTYKKKWGLE